MGCLSSKSTNKTNEKIIVDPHLATPNGESPASDVRCRRGSVTRTRISVTLSSASHIQMLKSVNEDTEIDIVDTVEEQKENDNPAFIRSLENPISCGSNV